MLAKRNVRLLNEAEWIGVEPKRFGLVVDEDARQIDLHLPSGRPRSSERSAMRWSGLVPPQRSYGADLH
jgi:hypothetical protein